MVSSLGGNGGRFSAFASMIRWPAEVVGSLFESGLSPSDSNGDLVKRRAFCPQVHETLVVIERPSFSPRNRKYRALTAG
jgi:hypothetical protein